MESKLCLNWVSRIKRNIFNVRTVVCSKCLLNECANNPSKVTPSLAKESIYLTEIKML